MAKSDCPSVHAHSSYSVRIVWQYEGRQYEGRQYDEAGSEAGGQAEVRVQVNRAQNPTVADLCNALVDSAYVSGSASSSVSRRLTIDGQEFAPHTLLDACPLHEGVEVGLAADGTQRTGEFIESVVAVIGGIDSGQQTNLGFHPVVVGRSSVADLRIDHPEVSQRHLQIEHRQVLDLDSRNKVTLEGRPIADRAEIAPEQRIKAGNAVMAWRMLEDDSLDIAGTPPKLVFNRPPRVQPPPPVEPFRFPNKRTESGLFPARAPTWATFVIPLALGLVLAVLFNPYMALFALLGPAMAVSSWLEGRGRNKKDLRNRKSQTAKDREAFKAYCQRAIALEVARRRFEHPDPAASLRWAEAPSVRLWERSRADADFLHLSIGCHIQTPWPPPVEAADSTGKSNLPEEFADLSDSTTLRDVPFVVDFSKGIIGIVGPRRESLARWLIMQAAVRYGPSDLKIEITESRMSDSRAVENKQDWGWTSWLSHTRFAVGSEDTHSGSPHTLAVCTNPSTGFAGDSALVLAETLDELPSDCTMSIQLLDDAGRCKITNWPRVVLADGISHATALYAARRLARFEDPLTASAGLPNTISLVSLLGIQAGIAADRVQQEWNSSAMAAPIGWSDGKVIYLDLPSQGPHGLIAGTTGSGKSELMRCLVTSLALTASPEQLNFVLIDYKGGSAFDACASLPHVVGMVTDLDERLGERALVCLRAELAYREQFLRTAQVSSINELATGQPILPRLLVVIDEFAALAAELPSFLESLVDIAQRGRSLGVHLLLGTQRPAGVVSPSIRSNTNIRIGLRMLDPHDSEDVIGTSAAVAIDQNSPGRAYVRYGSGQPMPFQVASVSDITPSLSDKPVVVEACLPNRDDMQDGTEASSAEGKTDLQLLVSAIEEVWGQTGRPPLRCPWPDPLPTNLNMEDLRSRGEEVKGGVALGLEAVALGLEDRPEEQAQSLCLWQADEKNLLLIGLAGSGASETLMTAVLQLTEARQPNVGRPEAMQIYGIDYGASNLTQLAELPHCESIFGPAATGQRTELLDFLFGELAERQSKGSQSLLLLLIDNLGALLHALEDERDYRRIDKLTRLYLDGPSWGITTVAVAESLSAVPRKFYSAATMQLLFRVSDSSLYGTAGVDASGLGFGRALVIGGGVTSGGALTGGVTSFGGTTNRGGATGIVEVQTAVVPDIQKTIADIAKRFEGSV